MPKRFSSKRLTSTVANKGFIRTGEEWRVDTTLGEVASHEPHRLQHKWRIID
jgi:hypothetical protein